MNRQERLKSDLEKINCALCSNQYNVKNLEYYDYEKDGGRELWYIIKDLILEILEKGEK